MRYSTARLATNAQPVADCLSPAAMNRPALRLVSSEAAAQPPLAYDEQANDTGQLLEWIIDGAVFCIIAAGVMALVWNAWQWSQ